MKELATEETPIVKMKAIALASVLITFDALAGSPLPAQLAALGHIVEPGRLTTHPPCSLM
jgi:hypothetical protein